MYGENHKITEETFSADESTQAIDIINTNEPAEYKTAAEVTNSDITKINKKTILKQRFKNLNPALKKLLPFIIVGLICFAAGFGVDRILTNNNSRKNLQNRPGIQKNSPQNPRLNNKKGSNINYKYSPN
ncbi:hypothetical protein M2651_13775 [Clostridium sp. SYSU_GA19001]|uniref:hypothetical protein n=1 Tax=Clostridium caldaquaticum TaxID=2940653 RepID=UPI0020770CD8|nr:hypothetical protein [Clostridium caldaquaticum]MCM8712064.1 hypothetical protein [Clostridium caldaquaticum]